MTSGDTTSPPKGTSQEMTLVTLHEICLQNIVLPCPEALVC